jgi:hypothetical protein
MTANEFATKEKELLSQIPKEFHSAISYLAYDVGHAYGYEEIFIHLQDYVSTLTEPIEKYGKRMLDEGIELCMDGGTP